MLIFFIKNYSLIFFIIFLFKYPNNYFKFIWKSSCNHFYINFNFYITIFILLNSSFPFFIY
ncbi:hypothetical protein C1646_691520 [Rhizophagus diaphanus]|nr:hypothetical protein C1646_691520 [Rhizophagus diaphanus] [Rhizophagus sp. MUCL 43196]